MRKIAFGVLVMAALLAASCEKSLVGPAGPDPGSGPGPSTGFRITTGQLPAITPLVNYTAKLEAAEGNPPYRFSASNVPAGLSVSQQGLISGTMNGCPGPSAMLSLSVTATDQTGATTPAFTASFPCRYESLPTGRRYLLDEAGARTHMWVNLLAEPSPARGSTVILGSGACNSGGCFTNLSLEIGFDVLPNPNTGTLFDIGFSHDGQNMVHRFTGAFVKNGSSVSTDPRIIWAFQDKFRYIVAQASFWGDVNGSYGTFPGESGIVKILFDYK